MKTITEIRRDNLLRLIETFGQGSVATLNAKIGLARTDATLTQIKNQNANSGTGKPRGMGDPMARRIEKALELPTGYMDNVNTFDDPAPWRSECDTCTRSPRDWVPTKWIS